MAQLVITFHLLLIDHSFLKSQSKYQMTVSGLDAFCQGIESFWCVNSNEESLEFSRKAIDYSWSNLKKATEGEDVLDNLSKASYFAGKAINITKTTAPHAFSYPFSTHYGFLHGNAVALTFPLFTCNSVKADERMDVSGFLKNGR